MIATPLSKLRYAWELCTCRQFLCFPIYLSDQGSHSKLLLTSKKGTMVNRFQEVRKFISTLASCLVSPLLWKEEWNRNKGGYVLVHEAHAYISWLSRDLTLGIWSLFAKYQKRRNVSMVSCIQIVQIFTAGLKTPVWIVSRGLKENTAWMKTAHVWFKHETGRVFAETKQFHRVKIPGCYYIIGFSQGSAGQHSSVSNQPQAWRQM